MNALACPASLKGVLSAVEAAAALVEGLGAGATALPNSQGGPEVSPSNAEAVIQSITSE